MLRAITRRRSIPDDIDEAVAVRLDRQRLLHQGSRGFAFLIEESVLRAGVGGVEAMAAQLGHLLVAASLPSVSLGVVPMHADRDLAWPVEGFWIFDESQVNVEVVSGYLAVTQAREIAMYSNAFTSLAEAAVYGVAARARITAALDALEGDPGGGKPPRP